MQKITKVINGEVEAVDTEVQSELLQNRTIPTSQQAKVSMQAGFQVNRFGQTAHISVEVTLPCKGGEVEEATRVCEQVIENVLSRNINGLQAGAEALANVPTQEDLERTSKRVKAKTTNK